MSEIITLKQLCEELNIAPRKARIKLREAIKENPELAKNHKSRTQWRWVKGSEEWKEIEERLTSQKLRVAQ